MGFWIEGGETMLFIGDSITDCGRRAEAAPLGDGYVRLFAEMATAAHPERMSRYINKGIGGNRVTDLQDRWTDDVLYHKPDKLSVKIGINDLHSVLREDPDAVPPARFEEIYDAVLERTRQSLDCPIVLITPFFISVETAADSFRRQVLNLIPAYIDVVERMSVKFGTRLCGFRMSSGSSCSTGIPRHSARSRCIPTGRVTWSSPTRCSTRSPLGVRQGSTRGGPVYAKPVSSALTRHSSRARRRSPAADDARVRRRSTK